MNEVEEMAGVVSTGWERGVGGRRAREDQGGKNDCRDTRGENQWRQAALCSSDDVRSQHAVHTVPYNCMTENATPSFFPSWTQNCVRTPASVQCAHCYAQSEKWQTNRRLLSFMPLSTTFPQFAIRFIPPTPDDHCPSNRFSVARCAAAHFRSYAIHIQSQGPGNTRCSSLTREIFVERSVCFGAT